MHLKPEDATLLIEAAAHLESECGFMSTEKVDATAALLRRLAVQPTDGLLAWHAQGEANEYMITSNGHWLASVRFNGELMPAKQEANLRAWTAGIKPAERLAGLRRLCGYVENGSDSVISIFQDDAAGDWTVKIAYSPTSIKRFYGAGLLDALDAAIAGTPEDD